MKNDPRGRADRQLIKLARAAQLTVEALDELRAQGANVDVEADGMTALHRAARNDDVPLVRALLERGADPNARAFRDRHVLQLIVPPAQTAQGDTPPEAIARALAMIDVLVDGGARLPAGLPLVDLMHGALPVLARLHALGADLEAANDDAERSIHRVIEPDAPAYVPVTEARSRPALVGWLIDRGVALDIPDGSGRTPLARALEVERTTPHAEASEVVARLQRAGAPPTSTQSPTERRCGQWIDEHGRASSFAEIATRHAEQPWLGWFLETDGLNDRDVVGPWQPRLLEGPLHLARDLVSGPGPWALVIEGDLISSGAVELSTDDYRVSSLVVLGDLRAPSLQVSGSARLQVEGAVVVDGVVSARNGDSGAALSVAGELRARVVLLDEHTCAAAGGGIRAIVVGSPAWPGLAPDVCPDPDHNAEIFVDDVLRDGALDFDAVRELVRGGASPFLPGIEASLQARRR